MNEDTGPVHHGQYEHPLLRRAHGGSTPMDPDWLLQRALLRDVSRALSIHARGKLLDVGCGGRPYKPQVPLGVRYFGVDAPAAVSSQPDVWALAGGLPFVDGSFDTVLCTEVLEHLAEPGAAVEEIARVLKPGGHLILTAPQTWFLHEEPFDFYRFTRFGLEHLCERAGLVPVERGSQGGFWTMVAIFVAVHVGSYARWLGERGRPARAAPGNGPPTWRRMLWPLRLPLALWNLLFAALETLPEPGIFPMNHLVVAEKPVGLAPR